MSLVARLLVAARPAVTDPEEAVRIHLAPRYRVLLHNDDTTPFDFVVGILRRIFHVDFAQATRITFEAHTSQVALVVVLALEEAEARVDRAHSLARTQKHPLTFTIEPET